MCEDDESDDLDEEILAVTNLTRLKSKPLQEEIFEESDELLESVAPLKNPKINHLIRSPKNSSLALPIDSYQYSSIITPNGFYSSINDKLSPNLMPDTKSRSLLNLENTPPVSPAQRSISPSPITHHTHRWKYKNFVDFKKKNFNFFRAKLDADSKISSSKLTLIKKDVATMVLPAQNSLNSKKRPKIFPRQNIICAESYVKSFVN